VLGESRDIVVRERRAELGPFDICHNRPPSDQPPSLRQVGRTRYLVHCSPRNSVSRVEHASHRGIQGCLISNNLHLASSFLRNAWSFIFQICPPSALLPLLCWLTCLTFISRYVNDRSHLTGYLSQLCHPIAQQPARHQLCIRGLFYVNSFSRVINITSHYRSAPGIARYGLITSDARRFKQLAYQ
jgi:hypothetical protein